MSWDVVIFNLTQRVKSIEEIDDSKQLTFADWDTIRLTLSEYFKDIVWKKGWGTITRDDFSITFCSGDPDETPSNIVMNLYGENSIYEIVELCRQQNWEVYDTSLGEMIDLDNPERHGYSNFQNYLSQIRMHTS